MIIVANKNGHTDGSAHRMIERVKADAPLVLVSSTNDFKFNDALLTLSGKPWVLFDYCEYWWDFDLLTTGTHRWGNNTEIFPHFQQSEDQKKQWDLFEKFVRENPPALVFKREMLDIDVPARYEPIEYVGWNEVPPPEDKETFLKRPINLFNYWGRSHEARVALHGDIFRRASKKGYAVSDHITHLPGFMAEEQSANRWVTLHIPHYAQTNVKTILSIAAASKLCVSMPGCGNKCFRTTGEAPISSVMVMKEDGMRYSYPWKHNENCIKFVSFGKEVETIESALVNPNLYEIYLKGVETAKKYFIDNYIADYIEPTIKTAILQ